MTGPWTFTVPGAPIAKGRPRATARGGHVRMYTPKRTADYERVVALCAAAAMPVEPLDGPLDVKIVVYVARPQRLIRSASWCLPCPTRPDLDNYVKAVLDGMSARWVDDAQVVSITASKWYAASGEDAHVDVTVRGV